VPRGLRPAAPLLPLPPPPPPPAPASTPRRRGQVPFSGGKRRQLDFRLTTTNSLSIGVLRHSGASTSLQFLLLLLLLLLLPSQVAFLAYFQLELSLPSRYLVAARACGDPPLSLPCHPIIYPPFAAITAIRAIYRGSRHRLTRRIVRLIVAARLRGLRRDAIDDRPEERRAAARRCATDVHRQRTSRAHASLLSIALIPRQFNRTRTMTRKRHEMRRLRHRQKTDTPLLTGTENSSCRNCALCSKFDPRFGDPSRLEDSKVNAIATRRA